MSEKGPTTATLETTDQEPEPDQYLDSTDISLEHRVADDISGPETMDQTPEDQHNRQIDREILGASTALRHDTTETAAKAVSTVDLIWAKTRNVAASPLKAVRQFRKNRAETSLQRRQDRLESKHNRREQKFESLKDTLQSDIDAKRQREQAMVDGLSSNRLQKIRQEKIDAKHAKRQDKMSSKLDKRQNIDADKQQRAQARVDSFEASHVAERRDKYAASSDAAQQRESAAENRNSERMSSVEQRRSEAIAAKELAHGRKALREKLRSEKASRSERKQIMSEIMGDTDGAALRNLGRQLVEARQAEVSLSASRYDQNQTASRLDRTTATLERAVKMRDSLPGLLDANQTQQAELSTDLDELTAKASEVATEYGDNSTEHLAAIRDKEAVETQVFHLKRSEERMKRQIQELPDEIARLKIATEDYRANLEKQRQTTLERSAEASSARDTLDSSAGDILGYNQATTNSKTPEENI